MESLKYLKVEKTSDISGTTDKKYSRQQESYKDIDAVLTKDGRKS